VKAELNDVIHAPNRLQICAFLSPLDTAEFKVLKEAIGVSDSVLSKHIKQLEDAGYVNLKKRKKDGRQHTWVGLTAKGRRAFNTHMQALEILVKASKSGLDVALDDPAFQT